MGFAPARLHADYPRLINCTISGYGSSGPYRDKKAYDLLIQAEAGLLSVTGTLETPSKVGISVADIAAGMYAYSGILTALLQRHQTGKGCHIEISMLEALAEWMGNPLYYALSGTPPSHNGASHATITPCGPFTTGDGGAVLFGVQNEREWERFCAVVLAQPALAHDERFAGNGQRVAHRAALHAIIDSVLANMTVVEVTSRLEAVTIANAEIRTVQGVLDHPQLTARNRWATVESPVGPLPALQPPATISGIAPRFDPIPSLGEQTDLILAELGYDPAGIARLRGDGII